MKTANNKPKPIRRYTIHIEMMGDKVIDISAVSQPFTGLWYGERYYGNGSNISPWWIVNKIKKFNATRGEGKWKKKRP